MMFPVAGIALTVLLLAASSLAAQGSPPPEPGVQWVPAPALFPRGARMAVLSGDPVKPVVLKVLLSIPDRYRMPPRPSPRRAVGRLPLRILTVSFTP